MKLGTIVEEKTHTLMGVISYEGKEIYTEYHHYKNTPVVFDIIKKGPRKRIDRAINVYSYNQTLELIYAYNEDKKELAQLVQIYNIFNNNNIKGKLSPNGKRGLNIINNLRKNKHRFI